MVLVDGSSFASCFVVKQLLEFLESLRLFFFDFASVLCVFSAKPTIIYKSLAGETEEVSNTCFTFFSVSSSYLWRLVSPV